MATPDIIGFIRPFTKGFSAETVGVVVIGCIAIILIVLIARFLRDRKKYDILVEITPMWALRSETVIKDKEPTAFQKKLGIKPQPQKITEQKYTSYFVPGAYLFNGKNGTYEIILKDGGKKVIQGIPYEFFVPINFKQFRRYLKLFRYGPADYKPCKMSYKGTEEIRSIYDSESTYIALKTQEEIRERYLKGNRLEKLAPYIFMVVIIGALIVYGVIQQKGLEKVAAAIGDHAAAIAEYTKALMSTVK